MEDVCPETAHKVSTVVSRRAQRFHNETNLLEPCIITTTLLDWNDLEVGKLLGHGGFSSVYQVRVLYSNSNQPPRGYRPPKHQSFALKRLRKQVINSRSFVTGAVDLVMESKLLERLHHPNIIKLHGKKKGHLETSFLTSGYFMVLEQIYETLDDKTKLWNACIENRSVQKHGKSKGMNRLLEKGSSTRRGSFSTKNGKHHSSKNKKNHFDENHHQDYLDEHQVEPPTLAERLEEIALPIANAMEYLHSRNVCFRDLKPQNVGFASDGTIRLFDFGLAVELEKKEAPTDEADSALLETTILMGQAGTARYMAPENALCKPYGLPCDVYSFGLVLWEICTCKVVFQDMTHHELAERVVLNQERPTLFDNHKQKWQSWRPRKQSPRDCFSLQLKQLMQACWHASPECRPSFSTVCYTLQDEIFDMGATSTTRLFSDSSFSSSWQKQESSATFYPEDNPKNELVDASELSSVLYT